MIENTQDVFKAKKKTCKWLGVLFIAFILCILLELVIIANHYPYLGVFVLITAWMIPALLIGGVKCLAYKIDPGPATYITDQDIIIEKRKLPWAKIQDVELSTANNKEMLFFLKKGARSDRNMECLSQDAFDSASWQRLKLCVEKHHKITKIKD